MGKKEYFCVPMSKPCADSPLRLQVEKLVVVDVAPIVGGL